MQSKPECSEVKARLEILEARDKENSERVYGLRESIAVLTTELSHVTQGLKSSNENTKNIATGLNKLRLAFYIFIVAASLTAIPTLGEAIPLILKLAG